jgi:hypothetical protein
MSANPMKMRISKKITTFLKSNGNMISPIINSQAESKRTPSEKPKKLKTTNFPLDISG